MQIVLNGFMGTGKTTIGKILAHRLGCQFYDLDDVIEKEEGKSVEQIFRDHGEQYFRAVESSKLTDVLKKEGVIALGGGALKNSTNLEAVLSQDNLLIGLCCNAGEIVKRVQNDDVVRPLLKNEEEPVLKVQQLLEERQNIYQHFDMQMDTTNLTPDQVALTIEQCAVPKMSRVTYPDGSYPIFVGRDLLNSLGTFIKHRNKARKVAIVTNEIVGDLYLDAVLRSLKEQSIETAVILVPDGEDGKNLDTVKGIYDQLAEMGVDRSSILLALGGGITGDMCGFAAASYMRGISYIQVPTTLLSMVDSSIGGKTGVNIPAGKNLVGAFKQPEMVVMDLDVLQTLPDEELLNGFGELIKHGFIADAALVNSIEKFGGSIKELIHQEQFPAILFQSLQVKRKVVQIDPFEKKERMTLNFGHTLGHAIEKASNHQIPHGQAVLIGMWFAILLSERLNGLPGNEVMKLSKIYDQFNLPHNLNGYKISDLKKYIKMDKKKKDETYRWILLNHIGEAVIRNYSTIEEMDELLESMGAIQ
jgi:3-dehydroquinate synthase